MRISDWSSDVCSSDLAHGQVRHRPGLHRLRGRSRGRNEGGPHAGRGRAWQRDRGRGAAEVRGVLEARASRTRRHQGEGRGLLRAQVRSEEHTSELQSLMRISYAVFCLKKKKKQQQRTKTENDKS